LVKFLEYLSNELKQSAQSEISHQRGYTKFPWGCIMTEHLGVLKCAQFFRWFRNHITDLVGETHAVTFDTIIAATSGALRVGVQLDNYQQTT